jgi:hypothetical protein
VMSLKTTPFSGKSGMSRMRSSSWLTPKVYDQRGVFPS